MRNDEKPEGVGVNGNVSKKASWLKKLLIKIWLHLVCTYSAMSVKPDNITDLDQRQTLVGRFV